MNHRGHREDTERTEECGEMLLTLAVFVSAYTMLRALRFRRDHLRAFLDAFGPQVLATGMPRHIAENFRLAMAHEEVELHWTEETIEKVERGELP